MRSPKDVAVCTALLLVQTGVTSARANESLVKALRQRYPVSRIEVQNAAGRGTVASSGTRMRVEADGVPGKPLHTTQANTKFPRFHARDYARVPSSRVKS